MSEITRYESDTAIGIQMSLPIKGREEDTNAKIKVVLVETASDYVATPYLFSAPEGKDLSRLPTHCEYDNAKEAFLNEVLNSDLPIVTSEIKQYASDVLEEAKSLERAFETNQNVSVELRWGDENTDLQSYENITVIACLTDNEKPATRDNIEYYFAQSSVFGGSESIYDVASNIVNINEVVRCRELDKEALQEFYDKNIHDIRNVDFDKLTEEQRDDMSFFSDWHSGTYGHRPHGDDMNVCFAIHNEKQSEGKEKPKNEIERE